MVRVTRDLWLVLVAVLFFVNFAAASELSDKAAALQPGEWVELSTNWADMINGQDFTWSDSASWDPVGRQVNWICAPVGTAKYRQYRYNEVSNTWSSSNTPHSDTPGHAYDVNSANYSGNIFYSRYRSKTVHKGTWTGSGYSWNDLPDHNTTQVAANSTTWVDFLDGGNGGLLYVSGSGNSTWYKFTAPTGWNLLERPVDQGENSNWGSYHQFSQYNIQDQVVWVGGGNGSTTTSFTLDSQLRWDRKVNAPCGLSSNKSLKSYDPAGGKFLLYCSGDWYEFDHTGNGSYTQINNQMINEPQLSLSRGMAQVPIPEYGVVMVIQAGQSSGDTNPSPGVWIYKHTSVGECGNGVREGAEACDGTDFGSATCVNAHGCAGTLACTATCTLNTTGCGSNGILDAGETCDPGPPPALDGETCESTLGSGWVGELDCAATCDAFDTSSCVDAAPPTIVSVTAAGDPTKVVVTFSEPVEQSSATTATNYAIDGGISVGSASQGSDLSTVTLSTNALSSGVVYTLTVNGVRDLASTPNTIEPNSTATFDFDATATIEIRIGASNDDAEEVNGSVNTSSTDLELVDQNGDIQIVGMRFHPVDLPQGTIIIDAYVQFQVDETTTNTVSLIVQGEASDNPPPFGSPASRSRTMASVAWTPPPWNTVSEAGPDQRTPNLAPILQEIVNRPGWTSGNAIVLLVTGSGTRTAEAYDGQSGAAPLLHVVYTASSSGDPPQAPTGLDFE